MGDLGAVVRLLPVLLLSLIVDRQDLLDQTIPVRGGMFQSQAEVTKAVGETRGKKAQPLASDISFHKAFNLFQVSSRIIFYYNFSRYDRFVVQIVLLLLLLSLLSILLLLPMNRLKLFFFFFFYRRISSSASQRIKKLKT